MVLRSTADELRDLEEVVCLCSLLYSIMVDGDRRGRWPFVHLPFILAGDRRGEAFRASRMRESSDFTLSTGVDLSLL